MPNVNRIILALLAIGLVTTLWPEIDLTVSDFFANDDDKVFYLRHNPISDFIRNPLHKLILLIPLGFVLLWLVQRLSKREWLPLSWRELSFLLFSLAIGPGLVVNAFLKEVWGRARPSQIQEFGGNASFSSAWVIADQCESNCAFVSGHASLAFWTIAVAFVVPAIYRARVFWMGLGFGVFMGMARIVQGAHFLSDVVFAGIISLLSILWAQKMFLKQ